MALVSIELLSILEITFGTHSGPAQRECRMCVPGERDWSRQMASSSSTDEGFENVGRNEGKFTPALHKF